LAALRARVAPGAPTPAPEHEHEATAWVEGFLQAPTRDIALDRRGFVTWQGRTIGKLVPGRTLLQPEARLAEVDSLGAGARSRLQRRIVAFARDVVHELLEPLRAAFPSDLSPDGRGLLHLLEQDFGTVLTKDALEQWQRMPERERAHLRANGLQVGSVVLYAPALLQRQALLRRITLTNIFHGRTLEGTLVTPFHERIPVSFVPKSHIPPRTLTSWGFVVFAHRAIRADMVDRIHLALKEGSASERTLSATIGSWLGCPPRNIPALGQKILEASCDPFSAPSSLQNAEHLLTNQSHGR
jgi:ATP-dependent RNA helicase SUPV3L1/SUV3